MQTTHKRQTIPNTVYVSPYFTYDKKAHIISQRILEYPIIMMASAKYIEAQILEFYKITVWMKLTFFFRD